MKTKKKKETTTYSIRFTTRVLDGIKLVAKKFRRPTNTTVDMAVEAVVLEHCELVNGKYQLKGE